MDGPLWILRSEVALFATSLPFMVCSLLVALAVVAATVYSRTTSSKALWKSKHILAVFSIICSISGVLFGAYGAVFTFSRVLSLATQSSQEKGQNGDKDQDTDTGVTAGGDKNFELGLTWMYIFIFHRFLSMGGDLLPSLDRCAALLFPFRFHIMNSSKVALGLCAIWILISGLMAFLAWFLDVVPLRIAQNPLGVFYLLTNTQFVLFLSVPYMILITAVTTFDAITLSIALTNQKRLGHRLMMLNNRQSWSSSSGMLTAHLKRTEITGVLSTEQSEYNNGNNKKASVVSSTKWDNKDSTDSQPKNSMCEEDGKAPHDSSSLENKSGQCPRKLKEDPISNQGESGQTVEKIKRTAAKEVKLAIRCQFTTFMYFLSQMCVYATGIVSLANGCMDQEPLQLSSSRIFNSTHGEPTMVDDISYECSDWLVSIWNRLLIFTFYQYQFIKPIVFLAIDTEFRLGVAKVLGSIGVFNCCRTL